MYSYICFLSEDFAIPLVTDETNIFNFCSFFLEGIQYSNQYASLGFSKLLVGYLFKVHV